MISKTNIFLKEDAKEKLLSGIKKLNDVIKTTIGPRGKYVLYDEYGPKIINDGITISDQIVLEDKAENLGVRLIVNISKRTNEKAGDGTTTAILLASSMIFEGFKKIEQNINPLYIRSGMNKTYKIIIDILKEESIKLESNYKKYIEDIAYISSGDKEVGALLSNVLQKVTKDGTITIQEGNKTETEVEFSQGMELNKGFISHLMSNLDNNEYINSNVYVFVTNLVLNNIEDVIKILEAASGKPLLIIAEDISGFALTTLIMNAKKLNLVAIKSPSFGSNKTELLEDICILTGANFFMKEKNSNLKDIKIEDLGYIDFLKVSHKKTTIVVEKENSLVKERKKSIKKDIENASEYEKTNLEDRLAKLIGGVCVIKIGAASEAEMKAKKLKFEDALNASKSAIEEGIICGGGIGLINIYKKMLNLKLNHEENHGMEIVKKALLVPFEEIVNNASYPLDFSLKESLSKKNFGLDAKDLKMVNMYERAIIDPVKVIRIALESAIKGASIILTTGTIITQDEEKRMNI